MQHPSTPSGYLTQRASQYVSPKTIKTSRKPKEGSRRELSHSAHRSYSKTLIKKSEFCKLDKQARKESNGLTLKPKGRGNYRTELKNMKKR